MYLYSLPILSSKVLSSTLVCNQVKKGKISPEFP